MAAVRAPHAKGSACNKSRAHTWRTLSNSCRLRCTPRACVPAVNCVSGTAESAESAASAAPDLPQAAQPVVPTSDVWELDFCSRPMLDERGKKVWELLICDPSGEWVHSKYLPNNKVNSAELKAAIKDVLATPQITKPSRIRFFRAQMQTIISRAIEDLDIKAVPSRRCFALMDLLGKRLETVYKLDPQYSEQATSMFQLDLASPIDIADALRGEQWAFVQLQLGALQEETQGIQSREMFGATVPDLQSLGLAPDTVIPGVAVFSRRATPLSAWTHALELACLKADVERCCLLLETGVRDRYRYGSWKSSSTATEEARCWEEAKEKSGGVHFLAIQTHPDADKCSGLWVMREVPPVLV